MIELEPIVTRVAHTGADELRFQGRKVFAELLGHASVGQMLVLGISGKLLDAEAIAIIDDIVTAMSSADPRMWPFKLTRLGAAHGLASLGTSVSLIAAEGGMFGSNRMLASTTWLLDLHGAVGAGPIEKAAILDALDRDSRGFGVLYRARDERFEALVRQIVRRGRAERPFTALCLRAVEVARTERKVEPHVFLVVAAICLDLGIAPHAIASVATLLLFHDSLANAVEGAHQHPTSLQSLPRRCVDYVGVPTRTSERANRSK